MAPKSYDVTPWVDLTVKPRGKRISKLPEKLRSSSGSDLYNQVANATGLSIHRLRITSASDPKLVISLNSEPLPAITGVQVKDLGPQISWRTVFIIEYIGPIIIHPLIYYLRPYIYKNASAEPSYAQWLSLILVTAHFVKRELETVLVHRFSNATMPIFNIFKNSGHYWGLSGLLIAYFTYSPSARAANIQTLDPILIAGLALFVIGELGNAITHIQLSTLRPAGTTTYQIPRGLGFSLVTCPNYMFETVAWVGILLVTQSWTTAVFIAVAVAQMAPWAWKKEKRLRKEFPDKYKKKRFAMLPGLI
jgi:very-long-chain enoyl-CoA reductase